MSLVDDLITELGNFLGDIAKWRLGEEFECVTTGIVLTRGKIENSPRNIIKEGQVSQAEIFSEDENCDEVVYQCKTTSGKCTISLFEDQIEDLSSSSFKIQRYGCVWHPLHRLGQMWASWRAIGKVLDIGSSIEVYPQKHEVAGMIKDYDGHYGKRPSE
jgi:uncharacterized protein YuzB (UPF0349 family)